MTAEQTPRQKYQAALERHMAIKLQAAGAFAYLRELGDERRFLISQRQDAEREVRRLEDDPANKDRRNSSLRWELAGRIEAARLEVGSIGALEKIVAAMESESTERAQTLGRQRDATKAVLEKMKNELLLLESAARSAAAN